MLHWKWKVERMNLLEVEIFGRNLIPRMGRVGGPGGRYFSLWPKRRRVWRTYRARIDTRAQVIETERPLSILTKCSSSYRRDICGRYIYVV
jgi:hypothetical protein